MKLKKILSLALALVLVLAMAACGGGGDDKSDDVEDTTGAATEDTADTADTADDAADADDTAADDSDDADQDDVAEGGDKTFALITKSAGNPYNERQATGFEEIINSLGYTPIVKHPTEITAEAQITLVNELIAQGVNGIAIAGNDLDALETVLNEAMDADIPVISMDSNVNADSRITFVNQAGVTEVAQALMDAVLDLTEGEGQWAILSATSTATNQNAWIAAMEEIAQGDEYSGLELVETAYGDDEYQPSIDETLALISNYPDLKVICAPTTVGISAAAKVVQDEGLSGELLVTGLGLPSEMAEYIEGDNASCPYMYLWNPIDVGACAAYTLVAIEAGEITGAQGETFTADGTEFVVSDAGDGGTEVIVGPPYAFDAKNIEIWKDVY